MSESIGVDVETALERIKIPSYVIDAAGVIRWTNQAAKEMVGDVVGRQFTSVVAPEDVHRAREVFARKILGTVEVTETHAVLVDRAGERHGVEICATSLSRGGRVVGVFGQLLPELSSPPPPAHPSLTPRQNEILRLLEHGRSTQQIALELHLSQETVRNHIRRLLRALGVHSRLEAVAYARHAHLVAG